ncbi:MULTISPECIES: hypothetical protein [Leptolyngbya]|uniref:hypothetical protein n=1 Tax=Leptolyngbya TaxID=47251 RepID=UPI00037C6DBD|nr:MULTISPECIES: hypothetical protein [Leptolyngbya]MBD2369508.1 hypothetical protein [Leptolyngbya sp. FACHB-161]MBD2401794.1 hypothetical protein [Leptolyngbya sp. FACHB-239]ULP27802.1 hypothetical protein MCP04_17380 [Leptolyngbya boryana IU 594]BAS57156.1 hypothetical protein LBWT_31090 [Leptolyngbya boryana IAM M-101]BAS63504.1 hypothetical protein LBDG_31090 [Leptolyngbya boryana dg5]
MHHCNIIRDSSINARENLNIKGECSIVIGDVLIIVCEDLSIKRECSIDVGDVSIDVGDVSIDVTHKISGVAESQYVFFV